MNIRLCDPVGFMLGIDMTEIRRFDSTPTAEALRCRILSLAEREFAATVSGVRLAEFVAGRFAAKEAVLKALRLPLGNGDVMREIEVLKRDDGSPNLVLHGGAHAAAELAGAGSGQVSISHSGGFAWAIALFLTEAEKT